MASPPAQIRVNRGPMTPKQADELIHPTVGS
jgi:hypothetical protein